MSSVCEQKCAGSSKQSRGFFSKSSAACQLRKLQEKVPVDGFLLSAYNTGKVLN